jgi:LPS-assembly protein
VGEPDSLLGGRWSMDTGLVGLTRTSSGTDDTRFSLEPGWSRQLTSDTGLVTTLTARARADIWTFQNYQRPESWNTDTSSTSSTSSASGTTGATTVGLSQGSATRAFPQGQAKFSYPLVRNGDSTQTLIEPMVALTVAPRISQKPIYPNEDSQDVELDATSLFQLNRFVGQDRQEGGQRLTYGLRTGVFGLNQGSGTIFVGQDYRLSNDQVFDATTGLQNQRSDYVGQIDLSPTSWLYVNYRTNINPDTLDPRRETLTASAGVPSLSFSTSYHYDQQVEDPTTYQLSKQEYTTFGMNTQISRYWSASFSQSLEQLPVSELTTSAFVLTYTDECLIFQTYANVNWAVQPGLPPGQTVYFRLVFKGLGEVKSPGFSLSGLEGSSVQTTH